MPAPFINYSGIAPLSMPGIADYYMNQKYATAADLANQMQALQNKQEPQRFQSQMENERRQREMLIDQMNTAGLNRLGIKQAQEQASIMNPKYATQQDLANEQQQKINEQLTPYLKARNRGMYLQNAQEGYKLSYLPKKIQQELLEKDLANKILEARAKYADKRELAELNRLLLSNDYAKIVNKYLPKQTLANIYNTYANTEGQRLRNDYYPRQAESQLAGEEQNILGRALQNYYYPRQAESQLASNEQNTLARALQNYYYPEQAQANIDQMRAQTNNLNNPNNLAGLSGAAHDAMSIKQLEDRFGADSQVARDARNKFMTEIRRSQAWANSSEGRAMSRPFTSMPAAEKERAIAYGTALLGDPSKAAQQLASGKTLEQMADEVGVSLADVQPVYTLGKGTRDKNTQRGAFIAEIDQLEKDMMPGMQGMGRKIMGYSFNQMSLALKGRDPNQQAEILAARALMPELSTLRARAMNANVGIEAMREITDKSLGNLKVLEGTVSPEVRTLAQQKMNGMIRRAFTAFDNYMKGSERLGRGPQGKRAGNNKVLNFDPATGGFY